MELDKRFKVLPFCCFGAEKCEKYIGQKGYFANTISYFSDINLCKYGTLGCILDESKPEEPFYMEENKLSYGYFIPECFVKPKEKQYRPYTFMEFTDIFTVGRPIKFRQKGKVGCERYLILNGYMHEQYNNQTVTYIYIGAGGYTLQELFEEYEWQEHYTEDFKPFGVEVEE